MFSIMINIPTHILGQGVYNFDKIPLTKNDLERKGFISSYGLPIIHGSHSRNLESGTDTEAMEECCLLVCSPQLAQPAFLYYPRPPAQGQ